MCVCVCVSVSVSVSVHARVPSYEHMVVHARVCGLSWGIRVCMRESLAFTYTPRSPMQVSAWHVNINMPGNNVCLYLQNWGLGRRECRKKEI